MHEMAVKLDSNKAYYCVQWDFLSAIMVKMGFATVWIQWVMELVSTVSFSVFVNGLKRVAAVPSRGLRQGDHFSPYFFVIIAEGLSLSMTNRLREKLISRVKMRRGCLILTHLFFANNALLFAKANRRECHALKAILDEFSYASG